MTFEHDVFISYSHLDNVELAKGHEGWVANLHQALKARLAMFLGDEPRIWRDPKLQGNDYFGAELVEQLQAVKTLLSVLSPGYVRSEWCLKEIDAFCRAAELQGGVRVGNSARLFKVLKTPVPLEEHPPELQNMLGYEFFRVDSATERVREFSAIFGKEAETDFWMKLDDLANDMCRLLKELGSSRQDGPPTKDAVYLAVTTADLRDERDAIKRDLEQHGYTVLPDRPLPMDTDELQAAVRRCLDVSRLSIHMVGQTCSLVPEGSRESLLEIQNNLAIERSARGEFSRLIWIPAGLQILDERQRKVVEQLRTDPRLPSGTDLLENSLEDLRTMIAQRLKKRETTAVAAAPPTQPAGTPQIYFLYDRRDTDAIAPWATFLFKEFEILRPMFDGDEADLREYHEENLRGCDGVMIFYGAANEFWLRRKLRELQKIAGYGRTRPAPATAICLIAPKTPEKAAFDTHEGLVIPQWDGFAPDALQPFVSRLRAGGQALQGDGVSSAR